MDFETLKNQPVEVIKEYLDEPEKLRELNLKLLEAIELIKIVGVVEEFLRNSQKLEGIFEQIIDAETISEDEANNILVDLIKSTGNVEKYFDDEEIIGSLGIVSVVIAAGRVKEFLTQEKIEEYNLSKNEITMLIKSTGKIKEYITPDKIKEYGLDSYYSYLLVELMIATGDVEEYLTLENISEYGLESYDIDELIKATGNVEKYLFEGQDINGEKRSFNISNIIKATGNIEMYLTPEKIKEYRLNINDITNLVKATGNIEKYLFEGQDVNDNTLIFDITNIINSTGNIEEYLTPEKVKEYGFDNTVITKLIKLTGNVEKYLFEGQDLNNEYLSFNIANIIKAIGNIEEYLTPEKIKEYRLNSYNITDLIKATGNIEKYLTTEKIKECRLDSYNITELIKATGDIEKYLTPEKILEYALSNRDITDLIKATGNIEEYLTPEKIKEYRLNSYNITELIKATGNIEKYLTLEKVEEYALSNRDITELIKATGNIEKYLIDEEELNNGFDICNVLKGTTWQELDKEDAKILRSFDTEIIKMISMLDKDKRKDAIKILDRLIRSNSAELRRIKEVMALQILEKEPEKYEETLNVIEDIYLTSNLPDVGKLYLVFQELHPNFLGEESEKQDVSYAEIPTLSEASAGERKQIIFSRLLRCAFESNNRDLRDYLETIEKGNETFEKIKNGEVNLEGLSESERKELEKYSAILNTLYNQTSKGRREEEKRENTGDVKKDLEELESLLNSSRIKLSLPDRIIRTFCYGAGIRTFEEAKNLLEDSRKKAEERNEELAASGKITLEEGDFVKGIANTEYFPSMLQRGILAKDFLGGNATSDCTPLDTDVEKIQNVGNTFGETLKSLAHAHNYTSSSVDGKKLGTIMIVFSKDNFIETRNSNGEVNKENVELLNENKEKKEVIHNFGSAYGISMGIGSENIKCIVVDKYVDKLGLEIAMNGFYIPIVDKEGNVIYTKEMYDGFREKMQGLSHYGETKFKLDETAKKSEMREIVEFVDRSKQNARDKQNKILKALEKAVEENGYELSDERKTDLIPGVIEFVDTGSTGRGTNMPGDGDFDFMVRMDKILSDNPSKFKDSLRKVLRRNRKTKRLHRNSKRWF